MSGHENEDKPSGFFRENGLIKPFFDADPRLRNSSPASATLRSSREMSFVIEIDEFTEPDERENPEKCVADILKAAPWVDDVVVGELLEKMDEGSHFHDAVRDGLKALHERVIKEDHLTACELDFFTLISQQTHYGVVSAENVLKLVEWFPDDFCLVEPMKSTVIPTLVKRLAEHVKLPVDEELRWKRAGSTMSPLQISRDGVSFWFKPMSRIEGFLEIISTEYFTTVGIPTWEPHLLDNPGGRFFGKGRIQVDEKTKENFTRILVTPHVESWSISDFVSANPHLNEITSLDDLEKLSLVDRKEAKEAITQLGRLFGRSAFHTYIWGRGDWAVNQNVMETDNGKELVQIDFASIPGTILDLHNFEGELDSFVCVFPFFFVDSNNVMLGFNEERRRFRELLLSDDPSDRRKVKHLRNLIFNKTQFCQRMLKYDDPEEAKELTREATDPEAEWLGSISDWFLKKIIRLSKMTVIKS